MQPGDTVYAVGGGVLKRGTPLAKVKKLLGAAARPLRVEFLPQGADPEAFAAMEVMRNPRPLLSLTYTFQPVTIPSPIHTHISFSHRRRRCSGWTRGR